MTQSLTTSLFESAVVIQEVWELRPEEKRLTLEELWETFWETGAGSRLKKPCVKGSATIGKLGQWP